MSIFVYFYINLLLKKKIFKIIKNFLKKMIYRFSLILIFLFAFYIAHISLAQQLDSAYDNNYKVLFSESTSELISVVAKYTGTQKTYRSQNNPRFLILNITVYFQSPTELRVILTDRFHKRWQIPEQDPFPHDQTFCLNNSKNLLYQVEVQKNPFSFKLMRGSTGEILFDTQNFPLILSDRYLEFSSILPSTNIYGLGERVTEFNLKFPSIYTIWARDLPIVIDDGTGGVNTYGAYPLYLMREKKGYFHMVFLRNFNGMDVILNHNIANYNESIPTVTYKITGGVIDLKFFISESKSPEEVVKAYHNYIGGYTFQPFWSMGFHQSRWGYRDWRTIGDLLKKYNDAEIPLDAIWMDIDYMMDKRVFTIDENRYPLAEVHEQLNNIYKKHLVLIMDPGVKVDNNYEAYNVGIERDIFIKDGSGTKPLMGHCWPGSVYYPDYFSSKGKQYWMDMIEKFHEKVQFSGIWLDMNELSIFVDGSTSGCNYPDSDYYYVYNPGGVKLDKRGLCLNALHTESWTEYNVHSMNGFMETVATYDALKKLLGQPQPFILTRSSIPGSGRYATHWTGDNNSEFKWLILSIAGIINFNIFGIPNTGADICGFDSDATEELCIRWMQVGTLYPFSRNHNHEHSRSQDPFSFGDRFQHVSLDSIRFRYSFLKYYYYLFIRNRGIGTVMKPLFFEFYEDAYCYSSNTLNQEFLLGDALLVTPVLTENVVEIEPYFPGDNTIWYEFQGGKAYQGGFRHKITNQLNETVPIFLRSGFSVYRQNVQHVKRSDDLDNKIYFSVAFNKTDDNSKFIAKGQFMACKDYGDYKFLQKCIDGDCLLNIDFIAKIKNDTVELEMRIKKNINANSESQYDTVYFTGLDLYGVNFLNNKTKIQIQTIDAFGDFVLISEHEGDIVWNNGEDKKVLKFGKEIGFMSDQYILIQFS